MSGRKMRWKSRRLCASEGNRQHALRSQRTRMVAATCRKNERMVPESALRVFAPFLRFLSRDVPERQVRRHDEGSATAVCMRPSAGSLSGEQHEQPEGISIARKPWPPWRSADRQSLLLKKDSEGGRPGNC